MKPHKLGVGRPERHVFEVILQLDLVVNVYVHPLLLGLDSHLESSCLHRLEVRKLLLNLLGWNRLRVDGKVSAILGKCVDILLCSLKRLLLRFDQHLCV